jgi:hypothetical protein
MNCLCLRGHFAGHDGTKSSHDKINTLFVQVLQLWWWLWSGQVDILPQPANGWQVGKNFRVMHKHLGYTKTALTVSCIFKYNLFVQGDAISRVAGLLDI